MENIIHANEKRENLLSNIGCLGCFLFILTGVIGCNIIKNGGSTFGWVLFGIGVFLYICMYSLKYDLRESGGALTRRRLSDGDLKGLKKEDLEELRCHIYARHGYNFNVNDGLYFIDKITKKIQDVWSLSDVKFNESNLAEYCFKFGCSKEQLIMALEGYNDFRKAAGERRVVKGGGIRIEKITEDEKDTLREYIERESSFIFDLNNVFVGYFNRNGEYGHEGYYYYHFKYSDWYKPTTCNMEEVYNRMSDIEKYNIRFIKAHENKEEINLNLTDSEELMHSQPNSYNTVETDTPILMDKSQHLEVNISKVDVEDSEEKDVQDDEVDLKNKSKTWLWVLLTIAIIGAGAGAWFYFGSDISEQSSEIEMEEDSELQKHLEEEQQKMEMMSFVKDFYSHYKEDGYIYDNVSESVLKKLRRDYPYECYEGDCLATWVFSAYPEGADMDFEVGPIITQTGSGIFNITFRYSYMNNGEKKYEDRSIRLYVGKVDGQYKITNYTYEDKSQAPRNDEEKRITEIPEGEYHLWCADMHMTLVVYDKIVEGEYYFQAGSTMSTSIKLNGRADNGLKLHLSQTSKVNGEDKGYMDGTFDGKTFKGEYDKDGYRHDFEIYVGGE